MCIAVYYIPGKAHLYSCFINFIFVAIYPESSKVLGFCRGEAVFARKSVYTVEYQCACTCMVCVVRVTLLENCYMYSFAR